MANPKKTKKTIVLINALHTKSGGAVTYIRNILPILARDMLLEVHVYAHQSQRKIGMEQGNDAQFYYSDHRAGFWLTLLHEQFSLPRYARKIGADVTFSPSNYGPIFAPGPVILIRNAMSVGLKERRPIKAMYWILLYLMTSLSALTARRVIAVTRYASAQLGAPTLRLINHKLSIVPHGVASIFLDSTIVEKSSNAPSPPELLIVSDIYVQKNLHAMIGVMAGLKKSITGVQLVIAGRRIDSVYADRIEEMIATSNLQDNVTFVGHKTPEELVEMYHKCTVFVFPSTVETFGNPLVEAMACGAVIACARSAAMPEVAGDAVEYFDPDDEVGMMHVIENLLNNSTTRSSLALRAQRRAKMYSWNKTAEQTSKVLLEASAR